MEFLRNFPLERWHGPLLSAARIVLILVIAWIAIVLMDKLVRGIRGQMASRYAGTDTVKRAETLSRVLRYMLTLVIGAVAIMLVLGEVGVSLAPILGAAGVVGLAIGFGAQSLVKDYFTGFFLLFEDQIRTGDVITVAGIGGVVEDITLRHVRLRDYDGNVHFVPNNLITTVTNKSRSFAQAVMDIGVAYRENTDEVLAVMREVGAQLQADPVFGPRILDALDVAGVDQLGASAVTLRCRFKVLPGEQWGVRREYLRRVKLAFDQKGIEIPYPHLTFYAGVGKDGTAPRMPIAIERARQSAGRAAQPPAPAAAPAEPPAADYARPAAPPPVAR